MTTAIERVERWLAYGVAAVRLPGGDWLLPAHFREVVALAKRDPIASAHREGFRATLDELACPERKARQR